MGCNCSTRFTQFPLQPRFLDLDIKGFFDNIPPDLLIRAVKTHAREPWLVLYIERWLKASARRGWAIGPA